MKTEELLGYILPQKVSEYFELTSINIYENATSKENAVEKFEDWVEKVKKYDLDAFITASESIKAHAQTILNFFDNRTTNSLAENFNAKIKAFRITFRGVRDLKFFLYRVSLIFA